MRAFGTVMILSAAFAAVSAGVAQAQEIPDLVGTWKGETQAVHIGPNPYRVPEHNGPNFPDNFIEFTYVVKEQKGARFAGETEGKFTETFIGMLRPPDYRSGIFVDDDGQYDFTLRDDTTIDMCYWHQYPTSKVIACWTLTKQP
jgi:hypothetical protein